jgi:dihydrolipoamide dehydrogenase
MKALDLNEMLQTELEHIWACGDVTGPPYLTHRAEDQGRTLATNVLGGATSWSNRNIPWALFTDPPVASIGLSQEEARSRFGDRLEILRLPLDRVDRAVIEDDADGEIVVMLKPGWVGGRIGGEIAGVQIIGARADELINQFAPFLTFRLPAGLLAKAVQVYPTFSLGARQAVGMHWRQDRFKPQPSMRSRLRRWWRDRRN